MHSANTQHYSFNVSVIVEFQYNAFKPKYEMEFYVLSLLQVGK